MARTKGPVIVRNVADTRRVWPDLTNSMGHTLDLEPGEEAMLLTDPGEVSHLWVRSLDPPTVEVNG